MTDQVEGQMSIFDLDTWSGKMFREHSVATKEETSRPSSQKSSKSSSQNLPMCLCLRKGDGQSQDASTMKWEDGQLLGDYTMPSFGERPSILTTECGFPALPNGVSESRLSQILQDSAHPKYSLSERAALGILMRASKRGKELPEVLYDALVGQSGLRSDTYGQTEISDAGEVLRTLWQEIGEKAFIEWVRRAFILVQQEKILLCGLCEQNTWRKKDEFTCTYCKTEQSTSEKCYAACPVRYLWERGIYGSTPQRQKSDEQRSKQLGSIMQELSRQTAPREVFMCCVRIACEGSQSLQQALASMEKEYPERVRHGIHADDKEYS